MVRKRGGRKSKQYAYKKKRKETIRARKRRGKLLFDEPTKMTTEETNGPLRTCVRPRQ